MSRESIVIERENELGSVSCGLLGTCEECQSAYGMEPREFFHAVHISGSVVDEGSFTWSDCELCGLSLGHDEYAAHAFQPTTNVVTHLSVCVDCLYYIANGTAFPEEEKVS